MDRFDGMCMGKQLPIYYKDTKVALVNNRVTTMSTKIVIQRDVLHDFKVGFHHPRHMKPFQADFTAETHPETLPVERKSGFV